MSLSAPPSKEHPMSDPTREVLNVLSQSVCVRGDWDELNKLASDILAALATITDPLDHGWHPGHDSEPPLSTIEWTAASIPVPDMEPWEAPHDQ
jgi:hypothetical protein